MRTFQFIPLLIFSALFLSISYDASAQEATARMNTAPVKVDTINYRNGFIYMGGILEKRQHGSGILIDAHQDTVYSGTYDNGMRHGAGKYFFRNENIYIGDWKANNMHGQGTMIFKNGDRYEGEWQNDQLKGKGTYFYANGDIYEGDFMNGKYHGTGKLVKEDFTYEGEWVNGTQQGKGMLTRIMADHQETYTGEFSNGKCHGQGEWLYEKDSVKTEYTGNWSEDNRVGEGTYIMNNREFKGRWQLNAVTGYGTCKTPIGNYEGNIKRGFFSGQGKMAFENGETYEGQWVRGQMQGQGTYTYEDGSQYIGAWHMNQRHGKGMILKADKTASEVYFVNGKEVKLNQTDASDPQK